MQITGLMKESNLMRSILLALSKALPNARLFRNNTGMAWAGKVIHQTASGLMALQDARPLHAGLCEGSSDLIGWTTVEITQEMVGAKVAVFTAVEVKQPGKKPTESQANFLQRVQEAGGLAMVATDPKTSPGDLKILAESLGT